MQVGTSISITLPILYEPETDVRLVLWRQFHPMVDHQSRDYAEDASRSWRPCQQDFHEINNEHTEQHALDFIRQCAIFVVCGAPTSRRAVDLIHRSAVVRTTCLMCYALFTLPVPPCSPTSTPSSHFQSLADCLHIPTRSSQLRITHMHAH